MDYILILLILAGFVGLAIFIYLIVKKSFSQQSMNDAVEKKLNEIFPSIMKNANEQLITMANEKLGAESKAVASDMANKKETIEQLVKQLQEEVKLHGQKLETAERDRIGSFNKIAESLAKQQEEIQRQRETTEKLNVTANNLKNVLSNNQLRGQFGEQVAEDLLRMSGFVINIDYLKQSSENQGRPDFTVMLPDGAKVNIDAKFPFNNLQRMMETEDPHLKNDFKKKFETDVKEKIKQVATRDYINPEDNTVDFAILFIPNEMIFSYIYENMNDIWKTAMENKVIFAGPFNFTAILRMIRQAYTNFKYQKDITKIINLIKQFEEEFGKYNKEFEKIGERIESLTKQYNTVNTTRTNQLLKTIDKVRLNDEETESLPEQMMIK